MSHVDLRLLFPVRPPAFTGARWLLGGALLTGLLGFFWACGAFEPRLDPGEPDGIMGAALFFSAIIAYIVPIFGYISERTGAAVTALRGVVEVDESQLDAWRRRVYRKPADWFVSVLTIGVASGIAHNLLLFGSPAAVLETGFGSGTAVAQVIGTMLTWIVLTTVVAGLLDNALMLARAARRARVVLLHTATLRPFATVAVISTLALIGAQAAFPLMNVDGELNPAAYLPGLLATGIPMVLLAALPVWPVHRRIAAAKRTALREVNAALAAAPQPDPHRAASLDPLTPLLTYRRELLAVSEWPFDLGVVTRLLLYLIIVPLTWVGAALIEQVVEALL